MTTKGTLPKKVVVILVDAYTDKAGVDPSRPDPRGATDFIIDSNFIASTLALLAGNRDQTLTELAMFAALPRRKR
ncbi:MAG: Patatin [Gammaproteobacteria bacterium]|nr:Patatin [Gammaproteobacteria bacterium]